MEHRDCMLSWDEYNKVNLSIGMIISVGALDQALHFYVVPKTTVRSNHAFWNVSWYSRPKAVLEHRNRWRDVLRAICKQT